MNKKALLIPMAVLAVLAIPGVAAAHNATANGTCQGGVTWSATNYDKTVVNTITVRVDGVIVHQDLDFKASDTGSYATDKTVGHVWSVDVDAPGSQYDRHLQGMYEACVVPTTTAPTPTTVVVTTTVPPTTSVPDVATTVVTTTSVVAVDTPPVPSTTVADVVVLTPVEPALPRTGGSLDGIVVASLLVGFGMAIMVARRRA